MTNLDYITIDDKGVCVGGVPTKTYRGIMLHAETLNDPLHDFDFLRRQCGYNLTEIHCLISVTTGVVDKVGTPSERPGQHIWARIKLLNGDITPWVYVADGITTPAAARDCVLSVGGSLFAFHRHNLRKALFGYDTRSR